MITLSSLLNQGDTFFTVTEHKVKRLRHNLDAEAKKLEPRLPVTPTLAIVRTYGCILVRVSLLTVGLQTRISIQLDMERKSEKDRKLLAKLCKFYLYLERKAKRELSYSINMYENDTLVCIYKGKSGNMLISLFRRLGR